jgi:hypothetical protein
MATSTFVSPRAFSSPGVKLGKSAQDLDENEDQTEVFNQCAELTGTPSRGSKEEIERVSFAASPTF